MFVLLNQINNNLFERIEASVDGMASIIATGSWSWKGKAWEFLFMYNFRLLWGSRFGGSPSGKIFNHVYWNLCLMNGG